MTDKLQAIRENPAVGWQRTYRRKNPWVKHIISSRGRAKRKGFTHTLTTAEIRELWFRDKAHELKRPSIDRIDNTKGYSKDNCRFIELSENIRLGNVGRLSTDKQREASRKNLLINSKKRWLRPSNANQHG